MDEFSNVCPFQIHKYDSVSKIIGFLALNHNSIEPGTYHLIFKTYYNINKVIETIWEVELSKVVINKLNQKGYASIHNINDIKVVRELK